jgi:hypothetical protein
VKLVRQQRSKTTERYCQIYQYWNGRVLLGWWRRLATNQTKWNQAKEMIIRHTHTQHSPDDSNSESKSISLCSSSCDTSAKRGKKRDTTAEERVTTPPSRYPCRSRKTLESGAQQSRQWGETRSIVSLLDWFTVDLLQTESNENKKKSKTRSKSKEVCTN